MCDAVRKLWCERTVRSPISTEAWQQIEAGYAARIGLREIARNMNVLEGTVLAPSKAGRLDQANCSSKTGRCFAAIKCWIVDAHRDGGRRYIVHSDELLSAFLELKVMLL